MVDKAMKEKEMTRRTVRKWSNNVKTKKKYTYSKENK
jgi:hypothetical protein